MVHLEAGTKKRFVAVSFLSPFLLIEPFRNSVLNGFKIFLHTYFSFVCTIFIWWFAC